MKFYLFFIYIFFISLSLSAQDQLILKYVPSNEITTKKASFQTLKKQINLKIYELQENGYLTASADSIFQNGDTLFCKLFMGERYKWSKVEFSRNIKILLKIDHNLSMKHISPSKFVKLKKQILEKADQLGFPFAELVIDSMLTLPNNSIMINLNMIPNDFFVFDTIAINGTAVYKQKYLQSSLGIRKGTYYKGSKIDFASQQIKYWTNIKGKTTPELVFKDGKVFPIWNIDAVKSNRFDGIVGLMPLQSNNFAVSGQEPKRQFLFTGELNLYLSNLFKSNKSIKFEWKQFKASSPSIKLEYKYPSMLGSKIDVLGEFSLFKNDSSFLNVNRKVGVEYLIPNIGIVKMSTGLNSSNISKLNTQVTDQNSSYFSNSILYYSVGLKINYLDQIFNSKKGFLIETNVQIGRKNILKSANIPDSIFNLYKPSQLTIGFDFSFKKYTKFTPKTIFVNMLSAKSMWADNIFINDLYRLGGNQLLRGFNENDFFATKYIVLSSEIRQYIEEESYINLFYDQGWVDFSYSNKTKNDFPFGIGAGFNFSSKAGMFNFAYALGNSKMLAQKIQLNQSRIHVGYISRF